MACILGFLRSQSTIIVLLFERAKLPARLEAIVDFPSPGAEDVIRIDFVCPSILEYLIRVLRALKASLATESTPETINSVPFLLNAFILSTLGTQPIRFIFYFQYLPDFSRDDQNN